MLIWQPPYLSMRGTYCPLTWKTEAGSISGLCFPFEISGPLVISFFFFFLPLCVSNLNPFPWSETSNTPLWLYREVVPPAD